MLLLSACSNQGVRLYGRGSAGGYDAGEFGYAAGGRDLRVIIVGNPFGGDQAAFGRVVTDAMQGRNLGPQTNFTTTPGPSAREIYRVVMVFDPPNGLSADTTCQSDPAALSSTARDAVVDGPRRNSGSCIGRILPLGTPAYADPRRYRSGRGRR
jgi:hypothetical protein